MNMKKRHYHARLCQRYVEHFDPTSYAALLQATEDNYKNENTRPLYTQSYVFSLFLKAKQPKDVSV